MNSHATSGASLAASKPTLAGSDHNGHGQHGGSVPQQGSKRDRVTDAPSKEEYQEYISTMHAGMVKMMEDMHSDPPSGDPDVDFLVMMIPHHQGAVEMARLVLLYGRDPLVRGAAESILASQSSEIQGMRGRLEALRHPTEDYPSLSGNRGP